MSAKRLSAVLVALFVVYRTNMNQKKTKKTWLCQRVRMLKNRSNACDHMSVKPQHFCKTPFSSPQCSNRPPFSSWSTLKRKKTSIFGAWKHQLNEDIKTDLATLVWKWPFSDWLSPFSNLSVEWVRCSCCTPDDICALKVVKRCLSQRHMGGRRRERTDGESEHETNQVNRCGSTHLQHYIGPTVCQWNVIKLNVICIKCKTNRE